MTREAAASVNSPGADNEDHEDVVSDNANRSRKALGRNAAISLLAFLGGSLSGVVATPLLLRNLGDESYGLWIFLLGLVGYAAMVEMGLGTATWRGVASAQSRQSPQEIAVVLGSSRSVLRVMALGCLALLGLVALGVDRLHSLGESQAHEARLVILILAIGQALSLTSIPYAASLIGRGRSDLVLGPGAAISLLSVFCQIVATSIWPNPIAVAVVSMLATAVSVVALRLIHRKVVGPSRLCFHASDRATLRELLRLGRQNAIINLLGSLSYGGDVLLVGLFLPISQVAAYAVATRLPLAIKSLATRLNDILVPTFTDAHAAGHLSRLRTTFRTSTTISLCLAAPPAALCIAAPGAVLSLWLGGRVPAGSDLVLTLLSIALLIQIPAHMTYSVLSGVGQLTGMVRFSIFQAISNITLSVGFTIWLGISGPAWGTLVEVAFISSLAPLLTWRHLDVRISWAMGVVRGARLALPTIVTVVVALITVKSSRVSGLLELSLLGVLLAMVQLAGTMMADPYLRRSVIDLATSRHRTAD